MLTSLPSFRSRPKRRIGTSWILSPLDATPDFVFQGAAEAEERLLVKLCSSLLRRSSSPQPRVDGIDWCRFRKLVLRHRLVPVVWRALHTERVSVPVQAQRELAILNAQSALAVMNIAHSEVLVCEAFKAARVAVVALKGVPLAKRYFGGIERRQTGDIDLLVAPGEISRAANVLLACGYRQVTNKGRTEIRASSRGLERFSYHHSFVAPSGVVLELHWRLHPNPAVLNPGFTTIFSASEAVDIGGSQISVLDRALDFFFLCTHGSRHNWKRAQWVYDLAVIVDDLDDEVLIGWLYDARRLGVINPVIQGLVMAKRLFEIRLPEAVQEMHDVSFARRFLVARAQATIFRSIEEQQDENEAGINLMIRLYRMCVTSSLAYHSHEVLRGFSALFCRIRALISKASK